MGVDRGVPLFRQILKRSDVVEMAVGHDDGGGTGVGAEAFFGGSLDQALGSGDAGVHQHPLPVTGAGAAEEDHVDDTQPAIGQIGSDLVGPVIARRVEFGIDGAGVF